MEQHEAGQPAGQVIISQAALLSALDDIRYRVALGDSLEGSIEWLMPEGPEAGPRDFAVRAAWRVGNLQGQGGMRMIGATASPAEGPESPRCTDWCRQQGSRGHYQVAQADKDKMTALIGEGLFRDGTVMRRYFPGAADLLYREGFGYHAIADWAGYSHEEGYLAITGQLAAWEAQ